MNWRDASVSDVRLLFRKLTGCAISLLIPFGMEGYALALVHLGRPTGETLMIVFSAFIVVFAVYALTLYLRIARYRSERYTEYDGGSNEVYVYAVAARKAGHITMILGLLLAVVVGALFHFVTLLIL